MSTETRVMNLETKTAKLVGHSVSAFTSILDALHALQAQVDILITRIEKLEARDDR